jgi:acyl-CoA thioesterase-1
MIWPHSAPAQSPSTVKDANAKVPRQVTTILVLGDSLSAEYGLPRGSGWVSLMASRLKQDGHSAEVVNASISGETTSGGKTRLPNLLTKHQPAIVIIELGGNDALRGLPISSTGSGLPNSGNVIAGAGQLGTSINVMNPYTTINYIIFTGVL